MKESEHIYKADDLYRYHSGKMSDREMHALERAALKDPFLADALEGYAHSGDPSKDLNELREKLSGSGKIRRMSGFPVKFFLRIAAIIILIAGAGYLAYVLNSPEQTTIAKAPEKAAQLNDSISTVSNMEVATDSSNSAEVSDRSSSAFKSAKKDVPARVAIKPMDVDGIVVDDDGNAVANAEIKTSAPEKYVRSDSVGRYRLSDVDSTTVAVVTAPGFKKQEMILKDQNDGTIVLEEQKVPASRNASAEKEKDEQRIQTASKRDRKRYSNTASRGSYEMMLLSYNDSTQAPVGGWDNFKQYVYQNLNSSTDKSRSLRAGIVVLSFDVNKNGVPRNVKIEESLCDECDKQARKLLVDGPRWKGSGRRALEIRF